MQEKYDRLAEKAGAKALSERTLLELKRTSLFHLHVDEFLTAYTDRLQPKSFEEFLKRGFDDPED